LRDWLLHNYPTLEVLETQAPKHATALAKEATEAGAEAVWAVGGDGTLHEVACGLLGTNTALGIIPMGSGNGLARQLNLPLSPKEAVKRLLQRNYRAMDVGEFAGQPFFVTAGIGLGAAVAMRFAAQKGRGLKNYLKSAAEILPSYKPQSYSLTLDGGAPEDFSALLLSFANAGQWGNDAWIAPKASLSDGKLDCVKLTHWDVRDFWGLVRHLRGGKTHQSKRLQVSAFQEAEIELLGEMPYHFQVDGEPFALEKRRFRVRCLPGALWVAT
jgi:diacylglycerol kinase family enzyme